MKIISQLTRNKTEVFLLFITLLLLSCNKTINTPIEHFEKRPKHMLTASKIIDLEEFNILKPGLVIQKDDSYMIWDLNNENIFHLVNFDSKKVRKGVRKGIGPDEIVSVMGFQLKEDRFIVYDGDTKKINHIYISSDTALVLKEIEEIKYDKLLAVTDYQGSHIVATGLLEDAWFISLKENGEIISKVDFPDFEETHNTTGIEMSMLYLSTHFVHKPDKKKLVAATAYLGLLSFLDCIDGSLQEYKQNKYYGPEFSSPQKDYIAWSKDGLIAFCGLDCDDEYVYALYSGRTLTEHGMESHHCEHLLVYDWNGNPIKHYILNVPLISMKYDKEKNRIYGIGYDPEGVFVEYQL